MSALDIHDRQLWNRSRLLLYGSAMVVGTLGVTIGVLSVVALLPPSLPLFLVVLIVGLLEIVAASSLIVFALDTTSDTNESE